MDDDQRLRYSRHLLLNEWSEDAQDRLLQSHALVIGAGGLGAPALMYLASAGVGRITVMDSDVVDVTNLQRQIIHTTARVGQTKVASAAQAIAQLNPGVQVNPIAQAADEALLHEWVPQADVVLDCTDRFAIRQLINRVSRQHSVPLVSASAVRFDGQISVFDPRQAEAPCYACLFPPDSPPEETRCAMLGVFAPIVGMMGVMQAGEAIKLLA
ncbi:MAG: HesA/MoeB/ThiF family protein, partial [Aquabacterium sp.]|nr:HesA/MoeB/ThiF family protein [Aquabacterium sp.]MCC7544009.1 HesA/MoeB/ThiF family protein [Aquabacterium sp.]